MGPWRAQNHLPLHWRRGRDKDSVTIEDGLKNYFGDRETFDTKSKCTWGGCKAFLKATPAIEIIDYPHVLIISSPPRSSDPTNKKDMFFEIPLLETLTSRNSQRTTNP
jgi:hypothetical protein